MRGSSVTDEDKKILSDDLKRKFNLALKGRLKTPNCRDCVSAQGFAQTVEFLIDIIIESEVRMDRASQIMEDFIDVFRQLEEREMKLRMKGEDGL